MTIEKKRMEEEGETRKLTYHLINPRILGGVSDPPTPSSQVEPIT